MGPKIGMTTRLPNPIPQIPVSEPERAISFYQSRLGFALDWKYGDSIAGVSREGAQLFLFMTRRRRGSKR